MLGPYIKSRGTKMSANADLITVETLCTTYDFNDQTKPILLSSYPLTHIYVHVK